MKEDTSRTSSATRSSPFLSRMASALDGLTHGVGKEIAHGARLAQPCANVRGGDVQRRDLDQVYPGSRVAVDRRAPIGGHLQRIRQRRGQPLGQRALANRGAREHGEVGQGQQPLGLAPRGHLGEGVPAQQEAEGPDPGVKLRKRIHQVGGTAALHLDGVDLEARVSRHGQPHPLQAVVRRCDRVRVGLLVRRARAGHEEHPFQVESLGGLVGRAQVTQMDGVESSAEDSDAGASPGPVHSRSCPSPNSTNFRVVSPSSPMGPYQ